MGHRWLDVGCGVGALVEWLLDHVPVSPSTYVVHATHLSDAETRGLARSGAGVVLCPTTEGNLGDGLFGLPDYVESGTTHPNCWYCGQLDTWEDPFFRIEGVNWLRENRALCETHTQSGQGGGHRGGGTRRGD